MRAMPTARALSHRVTRIAVVLLCWVPSVVAQESAPFFFSKSGWVSASGKWKESSGKANPPKEAVEIHCRLDAKECLEATAQVNYGEPNLSLQYYRVIEWNKNGIVAEDDSSICMTNRLLVSFQERSVIAIDTPKKGARGMPLGEGKNTCQLVNQTQTYKLVSR